MPSELATIKNLAKAIAINTSSQIDVYQAAAAPVTKVLLKNMTIHNSSAGTVIVTIHYRLNADSAATANQAWYVTLESKQTWCKDLNHILDTTDWVSVIADTANALRVWLDGAEIVPN